MESIFKLWGYTRENYLKAMSEVILSEERIHKLQSIESKELLDVASALVQYKRAGYQEGMIGSTIHK